MSRKLYCQPFGEGETVNGRKREIHENWTSGVRDQRVIPVHTGIKANREYR